MAKAKMIAEGASIDYTPASAVDAGDVFLLGDVVGIATQDIDASRQGALAIQGIFDFVKDDTSGPAFVVGDEVYWDFVNELAIHAPDETGQGVYLGTCLVAADASTSPVRVLLNNKGIPPCMVDREWDAINLTSAPYAADAEDIRKVLNVTGSASYVISVPATVVGFDFVIRAAVSGVQLSVSPQSADKLMWNDHTGTDNKDLILTAATARAGDYVHLLGDGVSGYYVIAMRGIWASEA